MANILNYNQIIKLYGCSVNPYVVVAKVVSVAFWLFVINW
jgi:hypothetical protein